jgi:hypothetical protein
MLYTMCIIFLPIFLGIQLNTHASILGPPLALKQAIKYSNQQHVYEKKRVQGGQSIIDVLLYLFIYLFIFIP